MGEPNKKRKGCDDDMKNLTEQVVYHHFKKKDAQKRIAERRREDFKLFAAEHAAKRVHSVIGVMEAIDEAVCDDTPLVNYENSLTNSEVKFIQEYYPGFDLEQTHDKDQEEDNAYFISLSKKK